MILLLKNYGQTGGTRSISCWRKRMHAGGRTLWSCEQTGLTEMLPEEGLFRLNKVGQGINGCHMAAKFLAVHKPCSKLVLQAHGDLQCVQ